VFLYGVILKSSSTMKKTYSVFILALIVCGVFAQNTYTWSEQRFQYPLSPSIDYLRTSGFLDPYESSLRENTFVYHLGDDVTYKKGDSFGRSVYAIADGEITVVQENAGIADDFKTEVHIVHDMPGGRQIEAVFLHLSSLSSICRVGGIVKRGNVIGYVGHGNSPKYSPHLHFEIRRVPDNKTRKNPYAKFASKWPSDDKTLNNPAKYFAPSLFVSDHAYEQVVGLDSIFGFGAWNYFYSNGVSRRSTAYIKWNDKLLTIEQAIAKGLISNFEYYRNGKYYKLKGKDWVFYPHTEYWVKVRDDAELHIPYEAEEQSAFRERAKVDFMNFLPKLTGLYHLDTDSLVESWLDEDYFQVTIEYFKSSSDSRNEIKSVASHLQYVDGPFRSIDYTDKKGIPKEYYIDPNKTQ
jgi:hypothetical protein